MGLNQVEFARKMNVTKQCVSNWENDNVQPSIEMLTKLADFFKVSTDFLLGRSESKAIDVSELSEQINKDVEAATAYISSIDRKCDFK